jgi:hypothetical protein
VSDIARILADWPYEPQQVSVRIVRPDDGRKLVQFRIDLGLML